MAGIPRDHSESLLQLRMTDDRTIWCWQYLATCTYASFPIRERTAEAREYLLRHVEHEATTMFGQRPLHMVMPDDESDEFPAFRFLGEFTSAPIESKDVSVLILGWFQHSEHPVMDDATRQYVETLDWTALATDIEW